MAINTTTLRRSWICGAPDHYLREYASNVPGEVVALPDGQV
jgi:hypothetical protein